MDIHTPQVQLPVQPDGPSRGSTRTINVSFTQPLPGNASQGTDFFKTNTTLIIWLFFLSLGGSLLALYYAHIGYLPDIEWKSALIYLAIASIIGTAVGLLLLLSLLIPGVIWDVFLVCDPLLIGFFCFEEELPYKKIRDPSFGDIFFNLGIPFGIVLAISHVVLPLGTGLFLVFNAVALGVCLWWMHRKFGSLVRVQRQKESTGGPTNGDKSVSETAGGELHNPKSDDDHKRILRYTFWFGVSLFVSQLSLLIIYLLSGSPRDRGFWILTVICTFTVLLSNHVVALLYAHHKREAILAGVIAALLLLVVANRYSSLPAGIMSLYGFGNQPFTIYVNSDGVCMLKSMQLHNQPCPDGVPAENKLCGVRILSELGSSYYLQREQTTLTLPKEMVIARRAETPPR